MPIVIHLWNVRKAKTLKVGSIALLGEASRQTSKSFRISEWLLLLLRCLLIFLLSLLMAKPYFESTTTSPGKPWLLVQKAMLSTAYAQYQKEFDSLLANGASLHEMTAGFPSLELSDSLSADTLTTNPACWQLLRQLDAQLGDSVPVYVYLPNRLAYFTGERPQLQLAIQWRTLPWKDSSVTTDYVLTATPTDSISLIRSVSSATGNYFTRTMLAGMPANDNQIQPGKQFCIFADHNDQPDVKYLQTALEAISEFLQVKFQLNVCYDPIDIPANQDAIFWLSHQPVDASIDESMVPGGILFHYGDEKAGNDSLFVLSGNSITTLPVPEFYHRHTDDTPGTLRDDSTIKDLVLLNPINNRLHYQFNSRFHPSWTNLVWSDAFPRWLLQFLFTGKQHLSNDLRMIDESQALPVKSGASSHLRPLSVSNKKDISEWIWLIAFLIFFTERWLSWRKNRGNYAG